MASTDVERKRKEREEKKAKGMTQKAIWFSSETIKIINDFKEKHGLSDEDAINELIKKALK